VVGTRSRESGSQPIKPVASAGVDVADCVATLGVDDDGPLIILTTIACPFLDQLLQNVPHRDDTSCTALDLEHVTADVNINMRDRGRSGVLCVLGDVCQRTE